MTDAEGRLPFTAFGYKQLSNGQTFKDAIDILHTHRICLENDPHLHLYISDCTASGQPNIRQPVVSTSLLPVNPL